MNNAQDTPKIPLDQIGLVLAYHNPETSPRDRELVSNHLDCLSASQAKPQRKECGCCICAEPAATNPFLSATAEAFNNKTESPTNDSK